MPGKNLVDKITSWQQSLFRPVSASSLGLFLMLLLTFLLIFTDADRWPCLKTFRRKQVCGGQVPFWKIFICRMQFVIVYFYAALSKVSTDWLLHAQPLKVGLVHKTFLGFSCN